MHSELANTCNECTPYTLHTYMHTQYQQLQKIIWKFDRKFKWMIHFVWVDSGVLRGRYVYIIYYVFCWHVLFKVNIDFWNTNTLQIMLVMLLQSLLLLLLPVVAVLVMVLCCWCYHKVTWKQMNALHTPTYMCQWLWQRSKCHLIRFEIIRGLCVTEVYFCFALNK